MIRLLLCFKVRTVKWKFHVDGLGAVIFRYSSGVFDESVQEGEVCWPVSS